MKEKLARYKAQFATIPEPLQKQVFIRLGFALVFLLLFILVLCMMFDWLTVVPFIGLMIYSIISAFLLFRRSVVGDYVVIRGRCLESTVTLLRRRTKSILMDADEHMVQVMLKQRLKRIPVGTELEIYVASNTQVYEKDGAELLHTYLAIHIQTGGIKRDEKSKRAIPETENNRGTHQAQ